MRVAVVVWLLACGLGVLAADYRVGMGIWDVTGRCDGLFGWY